MSIIDPPIAIRARFQSQGSLGLAAVATAADVESADDRPVAATSAAADTIPLFVDLDGAVIAGDLFRESLLSLIKSSPRLALRLPGWAARGRAAFKRAVAQQVSLEPRTLPFRADLLAFLAGERTKGRPIILATATAARWARQVADHLDLFDDVLASDGIRNLTGPAKLAAIRQYCQANGHRRFAYVGAGFADRAVSEEAAEIYLVRPSRGALSRARAIREPAGVFGLRPSRWRAACRVARPQQWVKNVLLFAPLALAHGLADASRLLAAVRAFLAFSLCASSVYVLNDLLDIQADRHHPRKRRRPFAAGALPVTWGPPLFAGLLGGGFALSAIALPAGFSLVLAVYLVATALYSFWLKRAALIDVFMLAGLYTLRLVAGSEATDTPISEWFMALSMFLFTSLAFSKRYTELCGLASEAEGAARGRGYRLEDMRFLDSIGPTSGYLAVLVLALYINSAGVKEHYAHPALLWLVCPLMLHWISRLWLFATRRRLQDDPVLFAVTDRVSLATAGLVALIAAAASVPW